jgi:hypothetical protein
MYCFSSVPRKRLSKRRMEVFTVGIITITFVNTAYVYVTITKIPIIAYALTLTVFGVIVPGYDWWYQGRKRVVGGRWDIRHLDVSDRF